MRVKKFKNGNINVLGYKDTIQECESYEEFICLLCNSIQLDFSIAGTVSTNVFGAYELWNDDTDKMYIISYDDFTAFVSGDIVKLHGYSYDKSDYEYSGIFEYLN